MAIHVSDSQLERIERGRERVLIVRSQRTKKEYAVIPQNVYDQVRPLLQCVAAQSEVAERGNGRAPEWTEEKNARRVALINKKHGQGLTVSEKKELAVLVAEAEQFRDSSFHGQTEILELILAGLKQQAQTKSKR